MSRDKTFTQEEDGTGFSTCPNSQFGDIVLICDESCPRNQWPLARVTEVYPSIYPPGCVFSVVFVSCVFQLCLLVAFSRCVLVVFS